MTELLNDPTVRSVALTGDSAQGHIWVANDGAVGCLVVQGLPEPGNGNVYQVWLRAGDQPVGVATFEPRSGSAWTFIRAEQSITEFDAIGITIEPRGGSPAPTGQRVLFGTLDALSVGQSSLVLIPAP
jgi:anti-sigma-K factor RskA